jgi:hypothetical protein
MIMKKEKLSINSEVGKSGMSVTFTTIEAKYPENIGMQQKIELSSPIKKGEEIRGIKIFRHGKIPIMSGTKVVRITDPNEKKFKVVTEISVLEAEFDV